MAKKVQHFITKEGLEKLKDELEHLKGPKKAEVAARLKEAISYGDLKENSEYEAAKNEQALLEARIREIEEEIASAEVITKKHKKGTTVELGSDVTVTNLETKEDFDITIVGSTEADPLTGKVSNESPLGEAILGKEPGDQVEVKAPAGVILYKVKKVA